MWETNLQPVIDVIPFHPSGALPGEQYVALGGDGITKIFPLPKNYVDTHRQGVVCEF